MHFSLISAIDGILCDNWVADFQTNNRRNQVLWHPRNWNLSRCYLEPFPKHSTLTTAIFLSQVLEVEDEMRILLQENALTKKSLEQRLNKLSSAFTEIQHDLAGSWLKDTMTSLASNFNDLLVPKKIFFLIGAKNAWQQWTQFFFCLCQNKPQLAYTDVRRKLNCLLSQCSTKNPWYFRVISVGMGNFLRRISKIVKCRTIFLRNLNYTCIFRRYPSLYNSTIFFHQVTLKDS